MLGETVGSSRWIIALCCPDETLRRETATTKKENRLFHDLFLFSFSGRMREGPGEISNDAGDAG